MLKILFFRTLTQFFIATNDFCAQYDLNGKRTEIYYNLIKNYHIPDRFIKTKNGIFLLSLPIGLQNKENLFHYWKLDSERIGYNIADDIVEKHPFDINYNIKNVLSDANYLYVFVKNMKNIPFGFTI